MRSNKAADAARLRLRAPGSSGTLARRLGETLGDPAYPHEFDDHFKDVPRKQVEEALATLVSQGEAVVYGTSPRRLYATRRTQPDDLAGLSAGTIRLLQHMPNSGGVLLGALADLMSGVGPLVDELVKAGLVMRLPGRKDIVFTTATGVAVRATLGGGLGLARLRLDEVEREASEWWSDLNQLATGRQVHSPRLIKLGYASTGTGGDKISPLGTRVWRERVEAWATTRDLDERDMVTGRRAGVDQDRGTDVTDVTKRLAEAEERALRAENDARDARLRYEEAVEREAALEYRIEREAIEREEAARRGHVETPRAYLLLRSDLPSMGVGKGRAQSMHAGNAMTWDLVVGPMMRGEDPEEDVLAWHREARGFGTAISLGGPGDVTARVVHGVVEMARDCGRRVGEIVDDTYPYMVDDEIMPLISADTHTAKPRRTKGGWLCCRRETTGAWLFGTKEQLDPLLARFGLTPDKID